MKSFRSRVLWLLLTLVALVQAATVVAFVLQTNRRAEQQAREDLQVGAHVLDALLQSRAEQLREAVRVLVADYGFKEAATLSDADTVVSALDNSAERVDAQLAVLLDLQGRVLAATVPRLAKSAPAALGKLAQNKDADTPAMDYLAINDTPYLLVSTPVRAPTPVAIAVLGFAVDAALAEQLSGLLKYQVSFVAGTGDTPRIIGSLPDWVLGDLRRQMSAQSLIEPQILTVGNDDYMTLLAPVRGASADLQVMLQKPLSAALSPYRGSRWVILLVALIALVSAIPLALRLAAQISIPLEKLAGAARRIETGDYTERVALDAPREFVAVASTLDSMQRNIAEREQRIRHQATHDELTGLANRRLATENLRVILAEAGAQDRPVALLVMEIIEFDRVRASFGFAVGDAVLRETARRLAGLAGSEATIARMAVAQFLFIAPGATLEAAEKQARQLLLAVRSGFVSDGLTISSDARVGIALFPAHGMNAVELQRRADTALFEAKEQGSAIVVYEPDRDERRRRQLALLGELRRALHGDELMLYFQPKVDMQSHVVHGVEALVRWNHPQLGCIAPDEFVPLAESTGNIGMLTRWVVKQALLQMRAWQASGFEMDIAVNLSATDLADPELADWVLEQLRMQVIAPERLTFEVTERAVMRETKNAIATMERLRQHGVRFSVDDFGTGFSSLAQFKQLPVDEIKIDKSFVLNLQPGSDDAAIVRATIDLGHTLGVRVVAEGVETSASWRMLREFGCDLAQGYLISKPIAADEVPDCVRAVNASLSTAESPTEQVRALQLSVWRSVA